MHHLGVFEYETDPKLIRLSKFKLELGLGGLNHSFFAKKACATVSLNNTNATAFSASDAVSILEVGDAGFQNIIPFPSPPTTPIDIDVPSSFELDFEARSWFIPSLP